MSYATVVEVSSAEHHVAANRVPCRDVSNIAEPVPAIAATRTRRCSPIWGNYLSCDFVQLSRRRRPQHMDDLQMFADLDIFARVAKSGNMSLVARDMRISPAVISKRICLLERNLGARLFQRTTRQLTLTEVGEGYLLHAKHILERAAEAANFVRSCTKLPSGLLRVTVPTTFSRLYLASRLPRFLERYPDITLELHVTDDVVDLIHEGFDIAIRIGELGDSSLVARKLSSDTRIICAAPSYLARAGAPKSIKELARHNCLSPDAQEAWRLEGPNGETQLRIKGSIQSNSAEIIREALISGLGIGLRSIWEIGPDLKCGALTVVLSQYRGTSKSAIYAVYPSREFRSVKAHAFSEFLAKEFGPGFYDEAFDELVARRKPTRSDIASGVASCAV
jgi:DNA-binding transcriptional LysR family regulator